MKKIITVGIMGTVLLFALQSNGQQANQELGGINSAPPMMIAQVPAARAKASAALANIYSTNNPIPLELYPPGYTNLLKGTANGTLPLSEMLFITNTEAGSKHLRAGDKANMHWLDASFTMGSPSTEAERNSDENQYPVIISYGFYMGNFEVTQNEYEQIVGSNPSYFTSANGYSEDLNRPVESVTWHQATNYCGLLTQQALANGSIPSGWEYRLPTEAEWEYSCRSKTAEQVATGTTGTQPPHPVPWTNPYNGITYNHYWIGRSHTVDSTGFVYYFNDSAPTVDLSGNPTTVGSLGGIGTKSISGHEVAWSDPAALSQGTEFGCSDITSGLGICDVSGAGNIGEHYAWCPDQYFSSDLNVYSSLGNGSPGTHLLYSSIPATFAVYNVFSFGDAIRGGYANFDDHYEYDLTGTINVSSPTVPNLAMTTDVGNYLPNGFGLYDMHGNVAEWCQDWYGVYPTTTTVDPQGPTSGTGRVVRGGSWQDSGAKCRSAARLSLDPDTGINTVGFRIVLAPIIPDWKGAVQTQPSIKVYGTPPMKSADNLVLITHGYTGLDRDVSFIDAMSNSISIYLANHAITDWQVYGYKWEGNSSTTTPDGALVNATQEGINLGNHLASQGWNHIHLIAHSAGAELIQTAMAIVKANSPSTVVQCTFLDPYVGDNLAGQSEYGVGADWSDRYSAHGDYQNVPGPYTDAPLNGAYNVDVTDLDPGLQHPNIFTEAFPTIACSLYQSSHGWPITFYENSITEVNPSYGGFGFPLSAEIGSLVSAEASYPVGVSSITNLGTVSAVCSATPTIMPPAAVERVDFSSDPIAATSTTGTVERNAGELTLITGSPAWVSIIPTNSNPVNVIDFDAGFESTDPDAAGLLTVYWDSNQIGSIDERTIGEGIQQYTLPFPLTSSNSTHILSFRIDPFTNVQSTVIVSNVVLKEFGVSQPFSLSVTTNRVNGLPAYQLNAEAGFDYGVEASTDLVNWTQIAVLENTNGTVGFYDPTATNNAAYRFYRAIAAY